MTRDLTGKATILKVNEQRMLAIVALIWTSVLFSSGASMGWAFLIALTLTAQGYVGLRLCETNSPNSSPNIVGLIGIGLAVGSATVTLLHQVFLLVGISIHQMIVTFGLQAVVMFKRAMDPSAPPAKNEAVSFQVKHLDLIVIACFAVALHTGLNLPASLVSGLTLLFWGSKIDSSRKVWIGLVAAVVGVFVLGRNWNNWWLFSRLLWNSDIPTFQMIMKSVSLWGIEENSSAMGQAPLSGYHWGAFAWLGGFPTMGDQLPFALIQFVAPMIASLSITAIIFHLGDKHGATRGTTALVAVGALVLFFRPEGSLSLYVSDIWLVSVFFILASLPSSRHLAHPSFLILLLMLLVSKRTSGLVVILALLLAGVTYLFGGENRSIRRCMYLFAASISTIAVDYFIAILLPKALGRNPLGLVSGSGFVWFELISEGAFGFAGSLSNLAALPRALFLTLSIFFLGIVSVTALVVLRLDSLMLRVATATLLFSAIGPFFLGGESLSIYYYARHPGVVASAFLFARLAFSGEVSNSWSSSPLQICSQLAAILSSSILAFYCSLRLGLSPDFLLMVGSPLFLIAGPVIWALIKWGRSKGGRELAQLILAWGSVSAVLVNVPKIAFELVNEVVVPIQSKTLPNSLGRFPSEDEIATADWIRENLPEKAIIGTNAFCDVEQLRAQKCGDENWWRTREAIQREEIKRTGHCPWNSNKSIGEFQNYSLAALSERRFFILGPAFVAGCTNPEQWINERMVLSERFARRPSESDCQELVKYGVTHFLVDERVSRYQKETELAEVVYRTKSFSVVRLLNTCRDAISYSDD